MIEQLESRLLLSADPVSSATHLLDQMQDVLTSAIVENESHASGHDQFGRSSDPESPLAIVVNAGMQGNVEVGVDFQLSGDVLGHWQGQPWSYQWSQLTGAGTAVFADANSSDSLVRFDMAGGYDLQLTAQANGLTVMGQIFIDVDPATVGGPVMPELPRVYVDTTYSLPTGGTTHYVNAGDDLQTALDTAVMGDVIVLEAGATFTGNFSVPNKAGSGWIYVISSELDQLPEGERVGLQHAHLMPKLVAQNNQLPVLVTMFGAHHFRFAGIEISTDQPKTDLIRTGYGLPAGSSSLWDLRGATTLDELPHHVVFDRMLLHSTSDVNRLRIGINLNGRHMAVINSYIANIKDTADAQAILSFNNAGPLKIVNNFLEATGENIMFGGNDPAIPNATPSDIEIRGNHFFKRLDWFGEPDLWSVKNLLEFKHAQRVLVHGNVFENNWADAQVGTAVLFSPRNQNGGAPWTVVQDISFSSNIIKNTANAIRISTEDGNHPSEQTKRIKIENNLIYNVNRAFGVPRLLWMTAQSPLRGSRDITITHNTLLYDHTDEHVGQDWIKLEPAAGVTVVVENLIFRDNVTAHGHYGIEMEHTANATISNNVIVFDPDERSYSNFVNNFQTIYPGNRKADKIEDVGFVDFINADYRLAAGSPYKNTASDGTDPGIDMDRLLQAINGDASGGQLRVSQATTHTTDPINPGISYGNLATVRGGFALAQNGNGGEPLFGGLHLTAYDLRQVRSPFAKQTDDSQDERDLPFALE